MAWASVPRAHFRDSAGVVAGEVRHRGRRACPPVLRYRLFTGNRGGEHGVEVAQFGLKRADALLKLPDELNLTAQVIEFPPEPGERAGRPVPAVC